MRAVVLTLLAAVALSGCGSDEATTRLEMPVERKSDDRGSMVPDVRTRTAPETSTLAAQSTDPATSTEPSVVTSRLVRGVDVSHHQGEVDWARVRRDRIEFAYLKATEGTGFVDPRYTENREAATAAGLQVGSYHFFSQCTAGLPQARHFVEVVGDQSDRTTTLAPAVDLELDDSCTDPPSRAQMLTEVRAFIDEVEQRTGRHVVVYAFPSFEEEYGIAADLGRRLWVRDLDGEPEGQWWIWQRSQTARVAGIDTPVDLNVRRD